KPSEAHRQFILHDHDSEVGDRERAGGHNPEVALDGEVIGSCYSPSPDSSQSTCRGACDVCEGISVTIVAGTLNLDRDVGACELEQLDVHLESEARAGFEVNTVTVCCSSVLSNARGELLSPLESVAVSLRLDG